MTIPCPRGARAHHKDVVITVRTDEAGHPDLNHGVAVKGDTRH